MHGRSLVVVALALAACRDDPGARGEPDTDDATTTMEATGPSSEATSGAATTGSTSGTGTGSDTDDPPDLPGDPFDPVPPYEPWDDALVMGFAAIVDGILASPSVAGSTMGVLIVDLETDQVLYERAPDDVLVPASNAKMFTTAATLDILGPDHRPEVDVLADAAPDAEGAIAGNVYVVAHHDFTWSTYYYASARFVADRLADDLYTAGVRSISGSVIVQGEVCYECASLGTYAPATERGEAATNVVAALAAAGISGGLAASDPSFDPPVGAVSLATWGAIPVGEAITHVNSPSHNEFADIMARHLGHEEAGVSDYGSGGAAIRDWMASLPTNVDAVAWLDGSGLSHDNRVSPRNIVDLLRFMTTVPHGEAWTRSLSIGGVRGTLSGRLGGGDVAGRVWAKTGTLPSIGVVSTSGYLFHRYDGRRYAFSIVFNGAPDVGSARAVHDMVIEALASDVRGVGGRPAAPTLRHLVAESESVVEVAWQGDADAYAVWLSEDGLTWALDDARLVQDSPFRADALPLRPPIYVRVTAVDIGTGGPVHSEATDVYGVTATADGPDVLVVDGNDRWEAAPQPENPRAIGHDFAAVHGAALPGRTFDTADNDAVLAGEVDARDYPIVVWTLGEESDVDRTFDDAEQALVAEFLDGGGALLVSGAELGYDLVEIGTPADAAFFTDVLRAGYLGDDAGTPLAHGVGPFAGGAGVTPRIGFLRPGGLRVSFPDRLEATAGGETWLTYEGGADGAAAVAHASAGGGAGRTVVMGIPLEAIDNDADRTAVMAQVLAFFDG